MSGYLKTLKLVSYMAKNKKNILICLNELFGTEDKPEPSYQRPNYPGDILSI